MANVSHTDVDESNILYQALNGYGVTTFYFVFNCIMMVLAAWIIALNSLVFDTLVRVKAKKSSHQEPSDWLVASLSMADLVTGIFLIYHSARNIINFQNRIECLVRYALLILALSSSVLHLALLTADRYVKIILPYRYSTVCNGITVTIMAVGTWLLSILFSLLPTLGWSNPGGGLDRDGKQLPVCSFFGLMHDDYLRFVVCLFFVPSIVMLILYAHICKVANRHSRMIAAQERSRVREKHSWKFTKTVLIVLGLYFFSCLPVGIVIILDVEDYLDSYTVNEKGTFLMYCSTLLFANSVANPIIYAVKISAVKSRFRSIFCKQCRGEPIDSTMTQVMDFMQSSRTNIDVRVGSIRSFKLTSSYTNSQTHAGEVTILEELSGECDVKKSKGDYSL
ncbi:adenosine receptor A3-like [Littorina saxatilis]|uniref:adenosine receptor A3-like n=1 Tax=Littorina saxatilis TaxID=31220 RepID=UPI0038B4553C